MGADWTRLLADPDLAAHLGELLKTYRDAPPEQRDQALLEVLRKIKQNKGKSGHDGGELSTEECATEQVTSKPESMPPFEVTSFSADWGQDRRRHPRIKCFVAVELRPEGSSTPIWGNLSNTSAGGCLVETAATVPTGVNLQVGLWLANGKIWVKGMALNGIATRSNPAVRIRFGEMEPAERDALREFLKYVESTTRGYATEHGYLARMKR